MEYVFMGIVLVGIVGGLAAYKISDMIQNYIGRGNYVSKPMLTANEKDFYRKLLQACGGAFHVSCQVSMGSLLDVNMKSSFPEYWRLRNKFSNKICDFVLLDTSTLNPVLVVELDDVMHDFNRDKIRDTLMACAGLRSIRFWSRKKPTVPELKSRIAEELSKSRLTRNN